MTDPTASLNRLIARLSTLISAATESLERDPSRADDWYDEVARQLRRYTNAAYISGDTSGRDPARDVVRAYIDTQLKFLGAFRDEIKASEEWQAAWNSRAEMYAESIKAPWWAGATRGWALPAQPGDGTTTCLTRCGCAWEIVELAGEGNADAYWRMRADEHCQICEQRASDWAPLRIRNGELQ